MSLIDTLAVKVSNLILQGADMSDKQFFEREIQKWKNSPQRIMQIKGHLYYDNEHDILHRKRMMIGEGGKLEEVDNLPNNRLIDNQYAKLVNQKANYLLGQPFAIEGENQQYVELLKKVFNKRFMKTLKAAGKAMLNNGICWLYPYYTETGEFSFRMFPGYEVLPFWKDTEHTILEAAVRLYLVVGYQGTTPVLIEKVEIYDLNGVHRFILDGSTLIPDLQGVDDNTSPYTTTTGADGNTLPLNWAKVPLIPLKYNECEIPLLKKVKTLQDGINVMLSDFENNMQEDARNTILVLKNYQDLYKQLEELDTEGKAYADIQKEFKQIQSQITKVQSDLKKLEQGDIIDSVDDAFSQERKDAAIWAKTTKEADDVLRDTCGEVWRTSPPIQKNAIYDYTQSYHKFNEPLRGIEYGSEKFLGVGNVDLDQIGVSYQGWKPGQMRKEINAMTDIISKSTYKEDFWLQRGCRFKGMDKFFNVPMDRLQSATQAELEQLLLNTTPTEYGFCSCGVAKGKWFSGDIILNIYAPSGAQMMYVEPFSAFGNGGGKNWDGIAKQGSFGQESEIILQQGTKFRVTKVEKTPGMIYIDLEVIEQTPQR